MSKPCETPKCRNTAHDDWRFCYGCRIHLLRKMSDEGYLTDVSWIDEELKARRGTAKKPRRERANSGNRDRFRDQGEPQRFHRQLHGGTYRSKKGK